jgi:HlyD family secretion protein
MAGQVSPVSSEVAQELVRVPGAAGSGRLWRFLGFGGAGLALLLGGMGGLSVLGRIFGKAETDPTIYVVRPVNLSITLTEDGELKPKNSVEIKCELEGQSTILYVVPESTQVKKGDVLIELASDAIRERLQAEEIELKKLEAALEAAQQELSLTQQENVSRLQKAEMALELAELELRRYVEGDYQRALASARMAISQTQMDIARREEELAKNRELAQMGFVTSSKIRDLEFELEKAYMQLAQNQLALEILDKYERTKNEKQKSLDVTQAREELARERQRCESREKQARVKVEEQQELLKLRRERVERLREQYEKTTIRAPVDGVVQYPSEEASWRFGGNRIAPGEKAFEGQTLLVLPDTSQMIVQTRIHEADRHRVREGLPCLVRVPAVPGRVFRGRISRIARFADTTNRWLNPDLKEHATEILLEETDAPISPGDSAEIRILIDELEGVLAVPVQCVFARGAKNYVFVRGIGGPRYVEVKLGRSNESMVEVVEGLKQGDEVLMQVPDELVATLPAPTASEQVPPLESFPPPASQAASAPSGPDSPAAPGPGPGSRRPPAGGRRPRGG